MPDQPEEAENPSRDLQSAADTTQSAVKTAANAAPVAMKGAGKAAQVSGKGLQAAGTGMQALAPIPVVGWISAGAGKGLAVAGKGLQAAGKVMEKAGGIIGKAKNVFRRITSRLARLLPVVGVILRVKDLIGKIPIIGPLINKLINKLGDLSKKILIAVGLGIGYLLYMLLGLLTSIVGICMVIGAAIGGTIGFIIGGPAGAAVGASVGASVGFFIGSKINAAIGTAKSVTSSAASIPGSITSGISSAISGLTGAVSGAFSAVTGAVGGFIGGIGSAVGGIGGALGGILNAAAGAVTSSVGTVAAATVGTVATVGGIQMAIGVPLTHQSSDADNPSAGSTGQNQYFKVTKTASAPSLPNSSKNQITFTINLTTTKALSAVTVTDSTNVQGALTNFTINSDIDFNQISPINCPKIIPAGGSCTQSFTIAVDSTFDDSIITNTVRVSAVPEGQGYSQSTATVVVSVGTPPTDDPLGWPTCGIITQGPYSSPTHNSIGYRSSIDINNIVGTKVYATHRGTITFLGKDSTDAIYVAIKGLRYWTFYVHLKTYDPSLSVGQTINAGTFIGFMDTTGIALASHVHYMIRDTNNSELLLDTFNSIVPTYSLYGTVTSSWGPC